MKRRRGPAIDRASVLAALKAGEHKDDIAAAHGCTRRTIDSIAAGGSDHEKPRELTIEEARERVIAYNTVLESGGVQRDALIVAKRTGDPAGMIRLAKRAGIELAEADPWYNLKPWERMQSFVDGYNGGSRLTNRYA